MKVLLRILLFLVVLCLLGGLLAILSTFVAIPWLSVFVQDLIANTTWAPLLLSIVTLVFIASCVLGLLLVLAVPSRHRLFVMNRKEGKIEITRQSIESVAEASLRDMPDIRRYHVNSRGNLSPGKVKVDVKLEPRNPAVNMKELGMAAQQRVAHDLAQSLDIDPKHIRVRIEPVSHTAEERSHSKVPRVV